MVSSVLLVASGIGDIDEVATEPETLSNFDETGPSGDSLAPPVNDSVDESSKTPFRVDTQIVGQCGRSCRTIKTILTNESTNKHTDILVSANIYINHNLIWNRRVSVGTLAPSESFISTEQVEVGSINGIRIKRNGGRVRTKLVIQYDDGQQVITRNVNADRF